MTARTAVTACVLGLVGALPAAAQAPSAVPNLTFTGGYAAFVDDGRIDHGAFGAGAEWVVTRHIALGPEVLYMVGPDSDRDLFVVAVARIGILPFTSPVSPFVTAGAGLLRHSDDIYGQSFSSNEGAFIVGGGVRIAASPRVFIAPEFTLGWEPHMRVSVNVGVSLP
jgi:hypothetical protein